MNESMSGNADDPNNFSSSISLIGTTAAREYVEHPYWFALAIILTAALALPRVMSLSHGAVASTALPSKPQAQSEVVTRSVALPKQPLTRSIEPSNQSLALSTELQDSTTELSDPTLPLSTEPQIQSMKFPNPFDSDEIFEFAPGTSKEDARAAVVEILKERALTRQSR